MDYLEVTGILIGLIYLWLGYRANIYLWIAGITVPAIYILVYYRARLHADFGISIYHLLAAVYGRIAWMRDVGREPKAESPVAHTSPERYLPLTAVFLAAFFGIAWILIRFTDSNVPWLDSLITALSITGMWMLAREYVEQWWAWILIDVICCELYIYKELYFTSALYRLYSITAISGYSKWKQMMHYESK